MRQEIKNKIKKGAIFEYDGEMYQIFSAVPTSNGSIMCTHLLYDSRIPFGFTDSVNSYKFKTSKCCTL